MKQVLLPIILGALLTLAACAPAATNEASTSNAGLSQTLSMNPLNTLSSGAVSTVTGTAELTALANGKTQVTVSLSGLEPNASSMGHVHVGDCSLVGPVALGLTAVEADANGNGTSVSEITTSQLPSPAYIAYHQRGPTDPAGVGGFISCGDIK